MSSQPTTSSSSSARSGEGRGFLIASFVLSALAILFVPIVLGPAGGVLGYVAHRKGDPKGKLAIGIAVAATIVGLILGALAFSALG